MKKPDVNTYEDSVPNSEEIKVRGTDKSAIGHLASHLEWKYIWYRIIALSWTNDEFRKQILELEPEEVRKLLIIYLNYDIGDKMTLKFTDAARKSTDAATKSAQKDRGSALRSCNKALVSEIEKLVKKGQNQGLKKNLKNFNIDDTETMEKSLKELRGGNLGVSFLSELEDPWEHMPPMEVSLPLPPPPEKDSDKAIALAMYAGSGKGYPFTSA